MIWPYQLFIFSTLVDYRNILSTNISLIRRQKLFRHKTSLPFAIPKFQAVAEKFCNFRRIGVGVLLRPAFENNIAIDGG